MTVIGLIGLTLLTLWLIEVIYYWLKYGNPFEETGDNFFQYFLAIAGTIIFPVLLLFGVTAFVIINYGDFIVSILSYKVF